MFCHAANSKFNVSLVVITVCWLANVAHSQVETRWIGDSGNWSDPVNWDNGVPDQNSIAIIDSSTATVFQDVPQLIVQQLRLNNSEAELVVDNAMTVGDGLFWQSGTISGGASLRFSGVGEINGGHLETTFENQGFIEFGADGNFSRLESATGGAWINRSGSMTMANNGLVIGSFPDNGLGEIIVEANSTFLVGGGSFQTSWNFFNNGTAEMNTLGFFFADFVQSADAQLVLDQGGADFFQVSELAGLVSGTGSIGNLMGPFDVVFEPGGPQIGTVASFGGFVMTPETVSNFQIGADLTADFLSNAGGPLQLDGILNIQALPGVTPGIYTLFHYNNSFMLQVDEIQLGSVPMGFIGFLEHDIPQQSLNLVVEAIDPIVLGDINRDGSVNLLDVGPMIDLLNMGVFQVEADINGDGLINLLDIPGFVDLLAGN